MRKSLISTADIFQHPAFTSQRPTPVTKRQWKWNGAIDGAAPFTAFFRVVLPTTWGGVGVTAIFAFIESWNEFLYAVVLTGSSTKTVPVAIFSFLTTEESLWGPFTATGVTIMAPVIIVALFAQRQMIKGMTLGATKG